MTLTRAVFAEYKYWNWGKSWNWEGGDSFIDNFYKKATVSEAIWIWDSRVGCLAFQVSQDKAEFFL